MSVTLIHSVITTRPSIPFSKISTRMAAAPPPAGATNLYRPLKAELQQIRLLTILSGNFEDEIRCTLNVANLTDNCQYETISYVWGDASVRSSIIVNGDSTDVPYSSMAAVRRMRLTDRARVVWIDAICINQYDNAEKSTQVALMSEIYARGNHNLVYLGDDKEGFAEEVLTVIRAKALQLEQDHGDFRECAMKLQSLDLDIHDGNDNEGRKQLGGHNLHNATIPVADLDRDLTMRLYELPWFRRLWVFQEAVLARGSICHWGRGRISLDHVLLVAMLLVKSPTYISPGVLGAKKMCVERMTRSYEDIHWSFFNFADICNDFESTEPKDHVFAPLSLLPAQMSDRRMSPLINPNYTKSTQAVFRDATRYTLEGDAFEANAILLLIIHHSQEELESHINSWTFQFGHTYDYTTLHPHVFENREFCAGFKDGEDMLEGNLKIIRYPVADLNILSLYVADLQSVLETTSVLDHEGIRDLTTVKTVVHKVQAMTAFDREITARVLTAGCFVGSFNARIRDFEHLLQGYEAFLQYLLVSDTTPQSCVDASMGMETSAMVIKNDTPSALFHNVFSRAGRGRCYFKTVTGLFGCGPGLMKSGDVVVIPVHAWLPLVLRPVGKHYLLLGPAYIDGVMHGEVFDKDVEWKWVDIR